MTLAQKFPTSSVRLDSTNGCKFRSVFNRGSGQSKGAWANPQTSSKSLINYIRIESSYCKGSLSKMIESLLSVILLIYSDFRRIAFFLQMSLINGHLSPALLRPD